MKEYKILNTNRRIDVKTDKKIKELEQLINNYALQGYRVIHITNEFENEYEANFQIFLERDI